jgi:diguanylate cyclase (GGDEF)-like protein
MYRYPLRNGHGSVEVLEVLSADVLDGAALRLVDTTLTVYSNMQGLLNYGQRDALTGLLNRKTFDEEFFKARMHILSPAPEPADERRVADGSTRSWIGMVDIDFFKRINDGYGHLIGDEVLLLVAQVLCKSCRPDDLVYRFGGEEFLVLLRCAEETDAAQVFERLRLKVETYNFPRVEHVTASIGFTELLASDSPAAALGRADQAVYFAKAHGRNQVQSHARLVAEGELAPEESLGDVELF